MYTQMLIAGELVGGEGEVETILDSATAAPIASVPGASAAQVDAAVAAAEKAFTGWARTPPRDRATLMLRIADRIEAEAAEYAALESRNTGKPLTAVLNDELPCDRRYLPLFCRCVPCPPGTCRRGVPGRTYQHDPARSGRRRCLDRSLELSAHDACLEDRAGNRRRQRSGTEALRADPAHGPQARRPAGRSRCRRAWSISSAVAGNRWGGC